MSSAPASTFIYVTYIRTTPEKLWSALTDTDFMQQYWFQLPRGERLQERFALADRIPRDGRLTDSGEILEAKPPKRLVIKWRNPVPPRAEGRRLRDLHHGARAGG